MSILKGFTILAIAITWNVKPVNAQECQPLKVETSQIVVANDAAGADIAAAFNNPLA